MEVITTEEMAVLDANCEYHGLSRLQLMENAGSALARIIRERYPRKTQLTIFAGRGNNGGDAFVAARHLHDYSSSLFLLGRESEIRTPEARVNWEILKRMRIVSKEVTDSTQLPEPPENGVVIDAIFGTGIHGELRPLESKAIETVNESGADVISVDVPSGLDPDNGEFEKTVRADLTITFHKPKPALCSERLKRYTGEVITVPIGIPGLFERLTGPGDVSALADRRSGSHKGDSGRILIIGGGPYTGAPALSALAALRAGADIVHVAAPRSASKTIASFSPDLIVTELSGNHLCEDDVPILREMIPSFDVIALGMGLGRDPETESAIREIIPLSRRAVIDADGLYALDLQNTHDLMIITPHAGEFERITGEKVPKSLDERIEMLTELTRRISATILLKSEIDLIAKDGVVRMNTSGNSGMTVGGTGDVLAGITAALLAKNPPLLSACAAAFINGDAGDRCQRRYGNGFTATDLIREIPDAMKA